MKKLALAMSVALVFGVSASAFAGLSWTGAIDSSTYTQWDSTNSKRGDMVVGLLQVDVNVKGSGSGTSTDKLGSYNYSANLTSLMTDSSGKSLVLSDYKAEIKDPSFTVAWWGRKGSYAAKSDVFGWLKSDSTKNSKGEDAVATGKVGNQKTRFQLTKYDLSVDFDNNNAAWAFYNTKVGKADVGAGFATVTLGRLVKPTSSWAVYGKQEVTPGVTVSGELALTTGDEGRKLNGANGAAGVKVDYKVSDALTTSAYAWSRGETFAEFNTTIGYNDRMEAGASATYKAGDFTYSLALADARHTGVYRNVVTNELARIKDDAKSSASIKWAPTAGAVAGLSASLAYDVTTRDWASEKAALHNWNLTASKKFLQDKLNVSATYKVGLDGDKLDPSSVKNARGTDVIGKNYTWYNDSIIDATYNFDANTSLNGSLQNISMKADKAVDDYFTREYAKLSRKVGSATVNLEYTSSVYDVDGNMLKDSQIQDAQTKLSFSVPF